VIKIKFSNKKYNIIYTDPPWNQKKGNIRKCRPNQNRNLDYTTCSLKEIKNIHEKFFMHVDDKYNIFMWTIDKYLHETEKMMSDLGYILHARIIWDKQNGIAPAFTVRFSHEYLLWFYKKGCMLKPTSEMRGKYTTVIREMSTKHSKKPEAAYRMIENMFPDTNKLELFAREKRIGWDSWGNEI
jgi:N6-adenosine-specific RNA methylase IME4